MASNPWKYMSVIRIQPGQSNPFYFLQIYTVLIGKVVFPPALCWTRLWDERLRLQWQYKEIPTTSEMPFTVMFCVEIMSLEGNGLQRKGSKYNVHLK